MPTVIDSLIVKLGLDASQYKKGREEAEKQTGETARKTKIAAGDISKALTDVGRTVAGLFLGFESVSGFAKFLGNLNAGEAQLGRTAKTIGMGVHELNKWGGAVRLAGGEATDAQAAFAKLTQDFTVVQTGGAPSYLLNFIRAQGVAIRDSNGKLRDQGQIFEELADKTAKYGAAYQATMFRNAGLNEGEINYLVQSKALRDEQLAAAERDNAVTDESVAKAQKLQEYWRNIGLQVAAAGQMILSAVTPALTQVLKAFGDINGQSEEFTTGLKLIGVAAIAIKNVFAGLGDALGGAAAAAVAAFRGNFREARDILNAQSANSAARNAKEAADIAALWNSTAAVAAKNVSSSVPEGDGGPLPLNERNHNPGNLKAVGNQPRDANGFRIFSSDAEGRAALDEQLDRYASRGIDTIGSIVPTYEGADAPGNHNDIPAYINYLVKTLGKGANERLTKADRAALEDAIESYEGGPAAVARYHARATPGLVASAGSAAVPGDASTTVTVGKIEVHSSAADPAKVADQTAAALQRKISVAQANVGQM